MSVNKKINFKVWQANTMANYNVSGNVNGILDYFNCKVAKEPKI